MRSALFGDTDSRLGTKVDFSRPSLRLALHIIESALLWTCRLCPYSIAKDDACFAALHFHLWQKHPGVDRTQPMGKKSYDPVDQETGRSR